MNLSELFIRRPVMTVLLNAAIVVAGVIAFGRIPVACIASNIFALPLAIIHTVSLVLVFL